MVVRTESWPPGTPCWLDLMVPDRRAVRSFYGPLFAWEFEEGSPETSFYGSAERGGYRVAGIGETPADAGGAPVAWITYLAVDDARATADAVTAAGGTVLMGPEEATGFGVYAVFADPTGAVFGVWQSMGHTGSDVANEPGSLVWSEVMTHDFETAKAFYTSVFGYTVTDMSAPGFTYATLDVDGRAVGGIGQYSSETPADKPAAWSVYFAVADTDAVLARVTELGGKVVSEAQDSPYGRVAVAAGPFGEEFALMSVTEPSHDAAS
jgi:predicted enzyme related to lactoylglutathione lyase